jgi:subtilisin family serine protease
MDLDHNKNLVVVPAEAGTGIAISATGPIGLSDFDRPASYTNYGQSSIWVAAPGGDSQLYPNPGWYYDMVFSTFIGGWTWMSGTSMAAPMVSGTAALVISKYGKMNAEQLKNHLANTADDTGKPGHDPYYGRGRINAYKAVTR